MLKILLRILIITTIGFLYGGRIGNNFITTRNITYTRITDGGTFLHHLEDIRQLAETWELPEPYIPAATEHDLQLERLREFATNLNTSGTEISDLRIIHIEGNPSWWTDWPRSIHVMFKHEEDYNNAELVAEMLAFVGICEDDIYIQRLTWGFYIHGWPGTFEFMMPNQAVYELLMPYLRLREFAMYVNSGTTYRDEIVVTQIIDFHQSHPIGWEIPPRLFPRYSVGLSPNAFTREIKSEILTFAGLEENDVQFEEVVADSLFIDFLLVNEEWMQLRHEYERLRTFQDMVMVRSARRNIAMDRVLGWAGTSGFRHSGPDDPDFNVGLPECTFYNEALRETLLTFTGIAEDNIYFFLYDPDFFGSFHTPTRHWLTPSQQIELETLEAFQEKVNAPFWYDRYLHDPIIVRIDISGRRRSHSGHFVMREYEIILYDPDLIGLTSIEIAWRTRDLRAEIVAATGVSNFRFRALRHPAW
ncbi:MAG: hypothetical protein FWC73_10935 [Defluviitaleaceae bacterium]|nr:hypothetical protein [Defluviitaleaceae bacterium]